MNYTEFKKTYKATLKNIPDLSNIFELENIKLIKNEYVKAGSKWTLTETKETNIDYEHYMNIIDINSIRFFKGLGGYEKQVKAYTKKGFIPVKQVSISPLKDKKSVYSFEF